MLLTILGLPSPFVEFCRDVCTDLAAAVGRDTFVVEIAAVDTEIGSRRRGLDTLASLAVALVGSSASNTLATVRNPDRAFCRALEGSDRPFLLLLEDPRRIALDEIRAGHMDAIGAARTLGTSCACLYEASRLPNAVRLTRDLLEQPSLLAGRLLDAFQLPATNQTMSTAVSVIERRRDAVEGRPDDRTDVRDLLRQELSREDALAVEAGLTAYFVAFSGEKLGPIIATRQSFCSAESVEQALPDHIDATGRARCLAYGPFMSLPSGRWTVKVVFAFSSELANVPFTLCVLRVRRQERVEAARRSFQAVTGRLLVELPFFNPESDAVHEFRIYLDKPVFDGLVSLGYAEITGNEPEQDLLQGNATESSLAV